MYTTPKGNYWKYQSHHITVLLTKFPCLHIALRIKYKLISTIHKTLDSACISSFTSTSDHIEASDHTFSGSPYEILQPGDTHLLLKQGTFFNQECIIQSSKWKNFQNETLPKRGHSRSLRGTSLEKETQGKESRKTVGRTFLIAIHIETQYRNNSILQIWKKNLKSPGESDGKRREE